MKKYLTVVVLVIAVVAIAMMNRADAHHAEISGKAICRNETTAAVSLYAEAWSMAEVREYAPDADASYRANPDVRIYDGDREVGRGSFSADNGYRFWVADQAPLNRVAVVYAVRAVGAWGLNGEHGTFPFERFVTVTLPPVCVVDAPPTVAPTTTVAEVLTPAVIERMPAEPVATPTEIVALPRFTG